MEVQDTKPEASFPKSSKLSREKHMRKLSNAYVARRCTVWAFKHPAMIAQGSLPETNTHLQRAGRRCAVGPEAGIERVRRQRTRHAREVLVHTLLLRQARLGLEALGQRRREAPLLRLRVESALVEGLAAGSRVAARLVCGGEALVDVAHRLVRGGALDDAAAQLQVVVDQHLGRGDWGGGGDGGREGEGGGCDTVASFSTRPAVQKWACQLPMGGPLQP